jgi:hypothetical protein
VQIIVGDKDVGTPVAMSAIHAAIPGSELVLSTPASSNLEHPGVQRRLPTRSRQLIFA